MCTKWYKNSKAGEKDYFELARSRAGWGGDLPSLLGKVEGL